MADVIKINDSTWRIEDGGVRFLLFCGTEKAALIDTGMTAPNAKEIAEGITDLPIVLINTHADPDHISGNASFTEFYMSPNEEENYRNFKGQGTILPVKEGDEIDLGGRVLRVIDIPGHTPGSIAILDEKNRVLVSGDTVSDSNIFMFGPMRNLDRYIESLEHLSEYADKFDEIYPMHGSFPVSPDLIGKLKEGAEQVRAGEVTGKEVEFYGNKALLYKFPYAGLLCDLK